MSQTTAFISHKRITLPIDGRHMNVDLTGSVFICKEAS
jgi:hypothetical protein